MKKVLLGVAGAAGLLAMPAFAADMPVKAPPPPPPAVATWSGCYIGGDAGIDWANGDALTTTATSGFFEIPPGATATVFAGQSASNSFDMSGGLAGVYGGCNYQRGTWVFGVEGDWSYRKITGTTISPAAINSTIGPITFVATNWNDTERDLVTARARVGYAYGSNVLLYVTGGAAWTRTDISLTQSSSIFSESQSDNLTGWTVGAGLEYRLFHSWVVRSEYLHVEFPTYTTFSNPTTVAAPAVVNGYLTNLNTKLTDNIWRFGISYRFWDWTSGGPLVTRY